MRQYIQYVINSLNINLMFMYLLSLTLKMFCLVRSFTVPARVLLASENGVMSIVEMPKPWSPTRWCLITSRVFGSLDGCGRIVGRTSGSDESLKTCASEHRPKSPNRILLNV